VRIRGSAHEISQRYVALAREAAAAGDLVAAENLYQHAEHYFRIDKVSREISSQAPPRPTVPADDGSVAGPSEEASGTEEKQPECGFAGDRPGFI